MITISYASNKLTDGQVIIKKVQQNKAETNNEGSIKVLLDLANKTNTNNEQNLFKISLLEKENKKLRRDLELIDDRNEQLFIQLEDAISMSMGPLKKMFHSLELPTENIIQHIKDTYSGSGGPFTPDNLQSDYSKSHIERCVHTNT